MMKLLPAVMVGALAAPLSGPAVAQQASGNNAVVANQAEVDAAIQSLRAAVAAGDATAAASILSGNLASNPQVARKLSETFSELGSSRGAAFLTSVVEKAAGALSERLNGEKAIVAIQQLAAGVTAGVAKANPGQAAQLVPALTAAAVTGAGKNESKVGQMARAVASGVVEALVLSNSVPISTIADLVRTGVSQGASKVVGQQVIVSVESTDNKPVSDVLLSTVNGKSLNPGEVVTFIPLPTKDNGDKEPRENKNTSAS